jgi:hypothetical protein
MRYYWLRDRVQQGQFKLTWGLGAANLADFFTKHHSPTHYEKVKPIYLSEPNSPPDMQGCIKQHTQCAVRSLAHVTNSNIQTMQVANQTPYKFSMTDYEFKHIPLMNSSTHIAHSVVLAYAIPNAHWKIRRLLSAAFSML